MAKYEFFSSNYVATDINKEGNLRLIRHKDRQPSTRFFTELNLEGLRHTDCSLSALILNLIETSIIGDKTDPYMIAKLNYWREIIINGGVRIFLDSYLNEDLGLAKKAISLERNDLRFYNMNKNFEISIVKP